MAIATAATSSKRVHGGVRVQADRSAQGHGENVWRPGPGCQEG